MLILIYPSPTSFPYGNHGLFSKSLSLFLFCKYVPLYHVLDSTSKQNHMTFIFLCLSYFKLSMIISRYIHVAAKGTAS